MTVTAYSYTRFSSVAQKDGDSLRRQLALAEEWAANHPDVVLDTTTRDLGVSAYHGEHRVKGALAAFLKRIEKGQIAPGSYLLIEQFDRLTREAEVVAMNLLTSILMAKIRVVTLNDGTELDETADAMDLMRAILSLSAGHIENKRRGGRLAEAWADKKRRARETGEILSKRGPAWTVFNETKKRFDLIPERADTVRRIFRECVEGFGSSTITNRLNEDPTVKPFVEGSVNRRLKGTPYRRAIGTPLRGSGWTSRAHRLRGLGRREGVARPEVQPSLGVLSDGVSCGV